ncbi:zinc-ribbon domain-containing protein [Carboxylicivirga marina]|uniref:zinc-ribbon domain-containing protein n=1 Tax=Carboxylicivirga marina TaxID=2800988 RepID=UPI0025921A3E|nr:zinc-ribbon domain-containing protein [uncultured Carboxylicivirga sp.]
MFCTKCGNKANEGDLFCSQCGNKLNINDTENVATADCEVLDVSDSYCSKCDKEKFELYTDNVPSGKFICMDCEREKGMCPVCCTQLKAAWMKKCDKCNSSWYEDSIRHSTVVKTDKIKCPKCKSTQLTSNKKGFSLGNAVVGGVLTGGVGLLGGFVGSNKIIITCLKCGKKWNP